MGNDGRETKAKKVEGACENLSMILAEVSAIYRVHTGKVCIV